MKTTDREQLQDIEKYKLIRERWDKEDTLLLSRTGIFLTSSSILYAALGFQEQDRVFQIGVAFVGLILSIFWLTTSLHSFNVIKNLFLAGKDEMPDYLKAIYRIKPVLLRPNTVFCKLVPGLILISWLVLIFWLFSRI